MSKIHIIYLSGFGDGYDSFRRLALAGWRLLGVTTELVPMRWNTIERYDDKIARINTKIQSVDKDVRIVIIGESAGGSMLLPVLRHHSDRISTAISLCGKNHDAQKVADRYYQKHVAFRPAMKAADEALAGMDNTLRQRLVVAYPLFDEVIPFDESYIPDCKTIRIPSIGHLTSIFLSLTIFSPLLIHIAKQKQVLQ